MLHLGAFTATIMSANVFFIIMPNQRIVVKDLKEGRTPHPKYGKIAKLRSTHNNYLTLPVLFLMLSNHYPLAFATQYTWIIASLVFLMGVDKARFRSPVIPDCELHLEIEAIRSHGRVWKYKGTAKVDGKRMADAEWSATIVDRKA